MTAVDPHPDSAELGYAGVTEMVQGLRTGRWSSRDLVSVLSARMDALDSAGPELGSVLARAADALQLAATRDEERARGRADGVLHGVPVLIKDNIEAVGLPGTAGSLALAGRPVTSDAPLVARLRAAGAVVIGATNLSEWANFRSLHSTSGWSAVGGLTGNPWALDRSAGGSSSGSGAAVAAGLAPVAIGTETNGSITNPAALNGVVGLKPTVGSVPMTQVVPVAGSQDVPGPLTRSVADATVVYEVLSGRSDCRRACEPGTSSGLRVGVVRQWLSGHAATDACFEEALGVLEPLVGTVLDVDVPPNDFDVHTDQTAVLVGELRSDLDAYLAARPGTGVRSVADVVRFNEENPDAELAYFGHELLVRAAESSGRAGDDYLEARRRNVEFARDACLGPALEKADVLIAPAYQPAWKSDLVHGDQISGGGAICTPSAILGWPILTLPMGVVEGLPVGVSITARAGEEPLLVAVGFALERALGLSGSMRPTWRAPMRG